MMQVFVSLLLVTGGVLLFAWSIKQADHEHADRLALIPIEDDEVRMAPASEMPAPKTAASAGGAM